MKKNSRFTRLILHLFSVLIFDSVYCRKCTFEDEATVVYCSNPLISEHLNFYKNGTEEEEGYSIKFSVNFTKIGTICQKYDAFTKCLDGKVTRKCTMKSLPNMVPLWEYLCSADYRKMAMDEHSCYTAIDKDVYVQNCFKNSNYSLNLNQILQKSGEQFCEAAKSHLECYTEFSHLDECQQAVGLQKSFYEFLAQNYTSSDAETKPACHFTAIKNLVQEFQKVQKERAIGGCDEAGVCKCIEGYAINNETNKCVDIDECSTGTHICSQKCTNKEGGYECACDTRFYTLTTPTNHSCTRSNSSDPIWLIFAHGQSIWNVSNNGKFVELKHAGFEKVAMLDVDVKESTIYFVDNGKNLIQRVAINANQSVKPEVIQNYEVDGVEGIAVDYIARNLYSVRKSDIFVQSLDGKYRMRIYKNKLSTPRALVLHSDSGMLYGSDWSSAAFLYKATTDGSHFQKIVTTDIVWPNGLTIDSYASRIYWADAFLDTIQSMDMNGGKRHIILANSGAVAHLFGLAVADDYIYWTDWNHRGILRANKLMGQNVTLLAQTTLLPYGLKVYHQIVQPSIDVEKNPCHNKNCSHLCILTKNGTSAMCGCSDGYYLSSKDGKTCKPDCKEPSKNILVCGGSEPKCVNKKYVCDGILHCPDRLDEQNCPERVCPLGQFQCLDEPNNCLVDSSAICDGTKQCKDGSDERFCSGKKT